MLSVSSSARALTQATLSRAPAAQATKSVRVDVWDRDKYVRLASGADVGAAVHHYSADGQSFQGLRQIEGAYMLSLRP